MLYKAVLVSAIQRNESSKCSDLVHWEYPEGSGGEGGGRWDQDGEYMNIHG